MTWLDGVLMLVLFATLGWWIDDGVGGTPRKTRYLFRRAPPHLRGRVPVDCGVGTPCHSIVINSVEGPYIFIPTRESAPSPPDAVGRAFIASVRHDEFGRTPEEVRAFNESWERHLRPADQHAQHWRENDALTSAKRKAFAATEAGRSSVQVTPEEYAAVLRDTTSHRWLGRMSVGMGGLRLYGVRLEVRPAPAENARRYTQEDSTW